MPRPSSTARSPDALTAEDLAGARAVARRRLVVFVLFLVAAGATVALLGPRSADELRDHVDDLGVLGPVAFLSVSIPLVAAFFPGPLAAGAAGLLFGTAGGTAVALVGGLGSSTLSFFIARRAGADAAERLAGARVLRWRDRVEGHPFVTILYLRLAPLMPFTVINYAVGLSRIRWRVFAGATLLGMAPRAFAYAALGGSLDDLGSPEAIVAICLLGAMALGAAISLRLQASRARAGSRPSGPGTGS